MIFAVRNGKKAEYLKNKIKKIGRKAIVIEFDVTKKETIKSLVDELPFDTEESIVLHGNKNTN